MSDDFMRSTFNTTKWYQSEPSQIVNATTNFINITNVHITEDYYIKIDFSSSLLELNEFVLNKYLNSSVFTLRAMDPLFYD